MITTIYIFILSYFVLGGIGFYLINRKKEKEVARKSWTKFIAYFVIIHILFFSIVIEPRAFRILTALIGSMGAFELFKLFWDNNFRKKGFFIFSMTVYLILMWGFWMFSGLDSGLILLSFLILSIFDAFSQISGQLWGKTKIVPRISPNKTIGGTVGGAIFAILSSYMLRNVYSMELHLSIIMALGIVVFAFLGDLAASFYKRKYEVKDYSNLIPGHGGFLDRFDSLIAGGAWVALFFYLIGFF